MGEKREREREIVRKKKRRRGKSCWLFREKEKAVDYSAKRQKPI